jgi:DNA-binding response OmpR family regulator
VLVVSDPTAWRDSTAAILDAEGYAVRFDDDGYGTRDEPIGAFDIAVVDLGLTAQSAWTVCSRLRARSAIPILAVAPMSAREAAVLEAYMAGADQCVRPTIRSRELLARVRALLRRNPPHDRAVIDLGELDEGSILVDPSTGTVVVAGQPVPLTMQESAILHALLSRPGRVVSRGELMTLGLRGLPDSVLDSLVRQVRNKLEAVEGKRRIVAVRGVGFRFLPAGEPAK